MIFTQPILGVLLLQQKGELSRDEQTTQTTLIKY